MDALFECIYRGEQSNATIVASDTTNDVSVDETTGVDTAAQRVHSDDSSPAPVVVDSYWNRLTSYFGQSYYAEEEKEQSDDDRAEESESEQEPAVEVASEVMSAVEPPLSPVEQENQQLRSKFDQLAAQELDVSCTFAVR